MATQLLRDIVRETTIRIQANAFNLLCPNCLVYCAPRKIIVKGLNTAYYYGCRDCGQSQTFLPIEGSVRGVLDDQMMAETIREGPHIRINWLRRRILFDFDEVEIINATDEDVERFAVQVGNDTNPIRQPHYKNMRCVVSLDCRLSENTMRILQQMFEIVLE